MSSTEEPGHQTARCLINGEFIATQEARISIFDHGLLYGDGVFEGLRFYNKIIFKLDEHITRLCGSADAISLPMPVDKNQLIQWIHNLVELSPLKDGYLRLILTRGVGALGIDPRNCQTGNIIMIADTLSLMDPTKLSEGIQLITATTRRISIEALDPRIKSLNYLNNILAKLEANQAQADEAILLNSQGHVCEASAENIFLVKDKTLYTPPCSDGALEGITRSVILELASALDIPNAVQSLKPESFYHADECFLTGSGAELIPVRSLDGIAFQTSVGPIYSRLLQAFRKETRLNSD